MTNAPAAAPRISELDGLRGTAILLVMGLHSGVLACGWVGVQLFFVLSGYLISDILLRTRTLPVRAYFSRFYRNRALRILPLYGLYLLAIAILFLVFRRPPEVERYWLNLATFTYNLRRADPTWSGHPLVTPFWSLSVEEQFYVGWPLIVFAIRPRKLAVLCVLLLLLGPAIRYGTGTWLASAALTKDIGDAVYWSPFSHLDAFAAGALVASTSAVRSGRGLRLAFMGVWVTTLLAGAVNMWAFAHVHQLPISQIAGSFGYPLASTFGLVHVWGYTLLDLAAAGAVFFAVRPDFPVFRAALRARWLVAIGRVSYGMYLIHWPMVYLWIRALRGVQLPWIFVFVPYALTVYLVAWSSFNLFERRFLALRARTP